MALNEKFFKSEVADTGSFKTVLYDGNGYPNSGTQTINVGFPADLIWIKERETTAYHNITDRVRGPGVSMYSNGTNAQSSYNATTVSFDSSGFQLGRDSGGDGVNRLESSYGPYVAWCWKAGGAASSNYNGTITTQVSANTNGSFSIVGWSGTGIANTKIGHGLGSKPELIILKKRNAANNWIVFFTDTSIGGYLDLTNAFSANNYSAWLNSIEPTSSVINLNNYSYIEGGVGGEMIAYCFASVAGVSKVGSYTGATPSTVTVTVGFQPSFIMIKRTDSAEDWKIIDSSRNTFANSLEPNESIAEEANNNSSFSSNSTSFTIGDPHGDYNASGGTYIYMAFA